MKRNMMTRFSAGCLTLLLMFGSVCRVQAAQEPAEPNAGQSAEQMVQTGSVTVQLTPGKEGTSVADVEFSLTKVGKIQDSTYVLLPEYESTKIDLNTLTTAEQLESAAKKLAETAKQEPGKKTDGTGQVVFEKTGAGSVSFNGQRPAGVRPGIPDPLKHPYHGNRRNLTLRHQSGTEAHPETSRAYGTPDRTV